MQQEITDGFAWLDRLEIGALDLSELEEALEVVARGMRDDPLTVAAFGDDPERRRQGFRRFLGGAAKALGWGPNMLVARDADGEIVGVCNAMLPGECLSSPSQRRRLLRSLRPDDPRAAGRLVRGLDVWARQDPKHRHRHLGPLVVDAHLQGKGVGSLLMRVFCAQMDAACEDTYLGIDKPESVRFCGRFGFEVVGEEEVLGVTTWFMLRRAEGRRG